MPRIAILGNEGSWYVGDLLRAAAELQIEAERIDFSRLVAQVGTASMVQHGGNDIGHFDAVIVRTMPPGSLEQVVFRMDVLLQLEQRGVVVLNPARSLECAVDKYLTTARLAAAGLPVPETVVCEGEEEALEAFSLLGGDVVVKPLFGAEGRGIVRVTDPDLALRTFRTLSRLQAVLYLQRFVDHPGHDIRVLVLDGKVIGSIKRHNPDDFRTNLARNGVGELHSLTDQEAYLARQAVHVTGARCAGVDLLYDRSGQCYLIEVNAVPGWRGFTRVTGIDVARLLLEAALKPLT